MTSKTQQAIEALDRLLEEFMTLDDDKFHWWYQEKIGEWQEKHRKALEQTQWQRIETAPTFERVLVFDGNIWLAKKCPDGSFLREPKAKKLFPTHWMPLPPQPEKND